MKVAVGADFSAVELKNQIKAHLEEQGHQVTDLGPDEREEQVIYPEAAHRVALEISCGRADRGIIICGTGGGVSIMANKFRGVYCVASESIFTAFKMRQLNGANVLALGKNVVGELNAYEIVDTFLSTQFCQDYGVERAAFVTTLRDTMLQIEEENFGGKGK